MSSPDALPAVVLGVETPIGLTVIRDLGMHQVEVHAIARSASAIGLASRYLAQWQIRAPGEEGLVQQLVELGNRLGQACLFAVSETDIALLNRHRERLYRYRLMFADEERMQSVLNKERTYEIARRVGIRVPMTFAPASLADLRSCISEIRFPVVLKWANPVDAMNALAAFSLKADKAHYCYTAEDLLSYLAPYEKAGIFPLIQEYCAGYGLGQFILMRGGQAQYTFQHRRLHEWPPEGGVSTVCESLPRDMHASLMEKSVALLRALRWEGIAMVEYRYDPDTGEAALMEVNGRFWGSLPLAWHAGAHFPWLAYKLIGLGEPASGTASPYRANVRCRFMIPETKRLLRILFQRDQIADKRLAIRRVPELLHYLRDFIHPRTRYYVFSWRDPGPFGRDLLNALKGVNPFKGHRPRRTPAADAALRRKSH